MLTGQSSHSGPGGPFPVLAGPCVPCGCPGVAVGRVAVLVTNQLDNIQPPLGVRLQYFILCMRQPYSLFRFQP